MVRAQPATTQAPARRVLLTLLGLCLSWALSASCKAPPLPESTLELDSRSARPDWSTFTIGPNDLVQVTVFGQPEYSLPERGVRVGPDGRIGVPLLGPVRVAGMTAAEAGEALGAQLANFLLEPSVTVSILENNSRRFFVLGQVSRPGPMPMDRPVTALEALSMAGPALPGARLDPVVIIRRQGDEDIEVIPFNAETPDVAGQSQLRPDDLVFVPRSGSGRFREEVLPYLQGLGASLSQLTALVVAYDRLD